MIDIDNGWIEQLLYVVKKNKSIVVSEIAYVIVTTVFLFCLSDINKKLNKLFSPDDYLGIISYDSYQPFRFFLFAFFLFVVGVFIIYMLFKKMRHTYDIEIDDIVLCFVLILMTLVFLILIIIYINNPILRAIFMLALLVGAFALAYS